MSESGKDVGRVEGYEQREDDSDPRTDNDSKTSKPTPQTGDDVKVLTSKPGEPHGVERLSRREPPNESLPATQVEVGMGDASPLDEHGRRQYKRII